MAELPGVASTSLRQRTDVVRKSLLRSSTWPLEAIPRRIRPLKVKRLVKAKPTGQAAPRAGAAPARQAARFLRSPGRGRIRPNRLILKLKRPVELALTNRRIARRPTFLAAPSPRPPGRSRRELHARASMKLVRSRTLAIWPTARRAIRSRCNVTVTSSSEGLGRGLTERSDAASATKWLFQ